MTEMIERVARAMAAKDSGPIGSILFDIHWREFGDGYISSALAAIEAMREPTEAMISAAWPLASEAERRRCVEDYQDMIDAALKEGA